MIFLSQALIVFTHLLELSSIIVSSLQKPSYIQVPITPQLRPPTLSEPGVL